MTTAFERLQAYARHSAPLAGLGALHFADDVWLCQNSAALEGLRARLQEYEAREVLDTGEMVAKRAAVYTAGWNRNLLAIHPDHLEEAAASSVGTPFLYEHNADRVLGTVQAAEVQDARILQDLDYADDYGRHLLSLGIEPRYSVRMQFSEATEFLCSVTGLPMFAAEGEVSPHWPGDAVDGETVYIQATHVTLAETSQVIAPAAVDTGLLMSVLHERAQLRAQALELETGDLRSQLSEAREALGSFDAITAELTEARRELVEIRGEWLQEKAQADIRKAKEAGHKLSTDELFNAWQKLGQEMFLRAFVDSMPVAARRAYGSGALSGVGPVEPLERGSDDQWALTLARQAQVVAAQENIPYREAHRRLYSEFSPAGERRTPRLTQRPSDRSQKP